MQWTLELLDEGSGVPFSQLPDYESVKRLCRELKQRFTINDGTPSTQTTPADLFKWACRGLDIDPLRYDHEKAIKAVQREHFRINRLKIAAEENVVTNEDLLGQLQEVLRVVTTAERFLLQAGRLYIYASANKDGDALNMLPKEMRLESEYTKGAETILQYDAAKLDHFQQLFLDLREQLESELFRRADSKFFRRVKNVNGETTLAFEEAQSIESWVGERCNYNLNFTAWYLSTRPSCNFHNIVRYLCERPLPEAPDLKEHPYMRSFSGDEVGRGSGVYDCESDMFFPYAKQNRWADMAREVEDARRSFNPSYVCRAPNSSDTALLHLRCVFPYDIYEEVIGLEEREAIWCVWREAYDFEVRNRPELKAPRLASTLAMELLPLAPLAPGLQVTSKWLCVEREDPPPASYTRVEVGADEVWLPDVLGLHHGDAVDLSGFLNPPSRSHAYISLPSQRGSDAHRFLVPCTTPPLQPRYCFGKEDVRSAVEDGDLGPLAWTRDARSGRFFCVCLGMHWGDCETSEMDQIYTTQKFTDYDRFQCYSNKGRQFFPVGARDKHQFAHVLEGVGGCGKSTDLMTQVRFYPPHRQGMFPGNIEPLFGLSAACKEGEASAMFCSEMSANMACKQEEFNQIISGDVVSAARKNKQPWCGVVRGQLFMVGNKKPGNYSDTEGQFTRRLLGIYMPNQVRPRDGRVAAKLESKMGALCRRNVLAYERFCTMWGSVDPMSQVDLLPPGFRSYFERSMRETNPMKAFLDDPSCPFERSQTGVILLQSLKDEYIKFRVDAGMGKGGAWNESHYHTVFQNYGLYVSTPQQIMVGNEEHRHKKIVHGLQVCA